MFVKNLNLGAFTVFIYTIYKKNMLISIRMLIINVLIVRTTKKSTMLWKINPIELFKDIKHK